MHITNNFKLVFERPGGFPRYFLIFLLYAHLVVPVSIVANTCRGQALEGNQKSKHSYKRENISRKFSARAVVRGWGQLIIARVAINLQFGSRALIAHCACSWMLLPALKRCFRGCKVTISPSYPPPRWRLPLSCSAGDYIECLKWGTECVLLHVISQTLGYQSVSHL